jgi:gamma-glutamylcyclotransferase (GGCT)/AIG2-like uncharacterized protein YtfP
VGASYNQIAMSALAHPWRLFVYGTLKRGERNHQPYCHDVIDVQQAAVWGRLHHLAVGYPMLEVPRRHTLLLGSADLAADGRRKAVLDAAPPAIPSQESAPSGDWQLITGEVISFADQRSLPGIDRLENFLPEGRGTYLRVVVPLARLEGVVPASPSLVWTYIAPDGRVPAGAKRIGTEWHGSPSREA